VIRTRVGYAGGTRENPTYHHLGDHAETLQVDYDPSVITYEDLLDIFWRTHSPETRSWSRQYMSAVFYHDGEQKRLAMTARDREAERRGCTIHTEILPAGRFYRAEDYHQKYYLRMRSEVTRALRSLYRSEDEFVDSEIAARLNGYFAGDGTYADVAADLKQGGFQEEEVTRLLGLVEKSRR
jgi:peptide-methionine (S)-S-oxide reductase